MTRSPVDDTVVARAPTQPTAQPDVGWPRRTPWRFAWIWAVVWLFYLAQPANQAWHLADPVRRWTALAAIVTFSVLFVMSFLLRRWARSLRRPLSSWVGAAMVSAAAGLIAVIAVMLGHESIGLFVYVAVMAVFLLPGRWGPITVVGLIVGTFAVEHSIRGWSSGGSIQFQIFAAALAMWGVTQVILRNAQLAEARGEITRLAVEEERNRLARDMHDILGHSLTVVSVKAELASRLVRLNPDRAEAEMAEVQRLSRQALADVRATVAGYREVTLSAELVNARSALDAAGIEAELPAAADGVPEDRRELFGWVIREGITNVIRHSGATRCQVVMTGSAVEVSDDGRGPLPTTAGGGGNGNATGGRGLIGLRERVEGAGGALSVGHSPSNGFLLRVTV